MAVDTVSVSVLDDEKLLEMIGNRPLVTNYRYLDNTKTNPFKGLKYMSARGGLFDETIFGMMGKCKCGLTITNNGEEPKFCENCKVWVYGTVNEQRKSMSAIELACPLVLPPRIRPLYEYLEKFIKVPSPEFGRMKEIDILRWIWGTEFRLIRGGTGNILSDSGVTYELDVKPVTNTSTVSNIGLLGLYKINGFKINGEIFDISKIVNRYLPVINDKLRPISSFTKNNKIVRNFDKFNVGYRSIIFISQIMAEEDDEHKLSTLHLTPTEWSFLYLRYNTLVARFIYELPIMGDNADQPNKFQLMRALSRKRSEKSMRATISMDQTLNINEVGVPDMMAYAALGDDIIKALRGQGMEKHKAVQAYKLKWKEADEAFHNILKNCICLLWRSPILHHAGCMAVKPIPMPGPSIRICSEQCEGPNADFDGDQVSIIFITDLDLVAELERTMSPSNTWTYIKNRSPEFVPNHEILLGLDIATKMGSIPSKPKKYSTFEEVETAFENQEIEFNEVISVNDDFTTYGRMKVEHIMGDTLDNLIPDTPKDKQFINKSNIADFILRLTRNPKRAELEKELRDFGRKIITYQGFDLPFEDFYDKNDPKIQEILKSDISMRDKEKEIRSYIQTMIMDKLKEKAKQGSTYGIAFTEKGFRIKDGNYFDLYGPSTLNFIPDKEDTNSGTLEVSDNTIMTGTSEVEYVGNGIENRGVQKIKRALTPVGGYVTRQLVIACAHTIYNNEDRPDPKPIGLKMTDKEALGRTTVDGKIVRSESGRQVTVRSSIFYDDNFVYKDEVSHSFEYNDGSDVGIAAAMSIMEAKTQAALGLKYGKGDKKLENVPLKFIRDGIVTEISKNFVVTNSSGIVTRYPIYPTATSNYYVLNKNIKVGELVKEGEKVYESLYVITEDIIMQSFRKIFGLSGDTGGFEIGKSQETKDVEYKLTPSMCYAPCDGTITYNTRSVQIGPYQLELSKNAVYYYPEGTKVKKYDRICSGVAKIYEYYKLMGDDIEFAFNLLKLQLMYDINNPNKYTIDTISKAYERGGTNIEIIEIIFKALIYKGFNIKKKFNELNMFDKIYNQSIKTEYSNLFKEASANGTLEYKVKDSLILPLILTE